jgi:predicted nucleotidyltransferase
MNLADLLRQIDAIFKNCRIPYAVIGGYAVAAWGEERATRDIDLFCADDSRAVTEFLKKENLHFERRTGDADDPISEVIRIDMGAAADPFEVDILMGIKNAPAGILNRIRMLNIESIAVPVASPEDIILLKLLGGSARDLEDAKSIVQIQGKRLDVNLMKLLCPEIMKISLEQLLTNNSQL